MIKLLRHSLVTKVFLSMLLATQLIACGGGGSSDGGSDSLSDGNDSDNTVLSNVATDVVLAGSVGDGPVTGATIEVWNSEGELIGSMVSDSAASFRNTFRVRGREYPLLLKVRGGIDLVTGAVPDFQMESVVQRPSDRQVNINPFSTLIVQIAEHLPGGLTSGNVSSAQAIVTGRMGFGLDANVIEDPITTQVTDANVANLVKSSEALGEMVRRTRDLLISVGRPVSGDEVVAAVAADMTDGYLDGRGASGSDAAIAAVANVVSAQVLVESLSNNLKVGGVIATQVIDQAIMTTRSGISASQLTGSVRVTQGMLTRARVSLAAAQVLDSSAGVVDLAAVVSGVSAGALPEEVAVVLPAESSRVLDNALQRSSTAGESEISAVNQVVQSENVAGGGSSTGGSTGSGNSAPVIGGTPSGSVVAGNSYLFQPSASDADGDALGFSVTNLPAWASFSAGTGRLSGTPSNTHAGTYSNIVIAVSDGQETVALPAFSIRVEAVNTAPVIGGTPSGSVVAGNGYLFQPSALDADGDALSFSVTNLPGWASFSAGTGRLSGTPSNTHAGTYSNIVIAVSDGQETVALPAFSIRVEAVNTAPVISGTPSGSVVAGNGYLFQPSASDADGDALSFSVTNLPAWASFSAGTGRLSGTPSNTDAGTYSNIVIAVSDGQETVALPAFGIRVEAVNTAPVISGTPSGSVEAGNGYQFQPSASDADGDALSFSVTNLPGWASFGAGTGRLSGTPSESDVGTYSNIVIAVSDGQETVALPAFSITVEAIPSATGGFALRWSAPTSRADGAPLSLADIDGFRIYYGGSPGSYSYMLDVTDGSAQSANVTDIPAGTYYLVMTTYDNTGLESQYSAEVSKIAE